MSIHSGPKKIIDSGLVTHIDTNTAKSLRGSPTTNYIPSPQASHNGSSFVNFGYNYANLGATYTYVTGVDNPVNATGILEYFSGTTGYKYFSIDSTSLPTTGTYTFSYYARVVLSGNASMRPIDGQLWRANGSDRSVTGDWNPTFTSEWRRYATTGPAEAATILQYFPVHSGSIVGGYKIQYCGFQLELGSYATPFVIGVRSDSQAVVDLVGGKTITPTNLNPASYLDSTCITLNGTNQYLYTSGDGYWNAWAPNGINGNANMTIELIFNSSDTSGLLVSRPWNGGGQYNYTIYDSNFGLHSGATGASLSYASICTGTNVHMAWWMNSTQYGVYKNGVQYVAATNHGLTGSGGSSGTGAFGTLFGSLYPYGDGWAGNTGFSIAGKYYLAKIYNRVLSATEIQENFNAQRGRYGL